MKRISFYIVIVLLGVSFFTSCEEQGLLTHTNDVSYIAFEKNMTTDTTGVSFKFYNEGENAKILLGVTISGKVQDKDLEFTVSVDPERTTLHMAGIIYQQDEDLNQVKFQVAHYQLLASALTVIEGHKIILIL